MYNKGTLIHNRDYKKETMQSRKFVEKKRSKRVFGYVFLLLFFAIVLFGTSKLFAISFLQIETIEIVGADADMATSIRASALESIQGSYMGLFSRSNTLIYPKSVIVDSTKKTSPEIENVHVERNGRKAVIIEVIAKVPVAQMCTSLPDFSDDAQQGSCFFVDKDGFVFKQDTKYDSLLPKIYVQQGTTTNVIGSTPIQKERFSTLVDFYRKVVASKIKVQGLLLSEVHDELYVVNESSSGTISENIAVVYFSEKHPLDDTLLNLVSFWNHMKSDKVPHHFSEIKLQFPPNVYYTEIK